MHMYIYIYIHLYFCLHYVIFSHLPHIVWPVDKTQVRKTHTDPNNTSVVAGPVYWPHELRRTYIHTLTPTHKCTPHAAAHMYTHTHTSTYIYTHTCTYTCIQKRMSTYS